MAPSHLLLAALLATLVATQSCPDPDPASTLLHLPDPPYDNYLYSDCHSSSHVVLTSPLPSSDLQVVRPRLLVAWPAGNSGIVAYFNPLNAQNNTLSIGLDNSTTTREPLIAIYEPVKDQNPRVGISGTITLDAPAFLKDPVLGSIRSIRDFVEGGGKLDPTVQGGLQISQSDNGGASINRTWLDNVTTTYLSFAPLNGAQNVAVNNTMIVFGSGSYQFNASFNYPQLEQLTPSQVLNQQSADLISQNPDQATSLSFLSYDSKLLAGTWRFLTYFGRDSMISALLLQPILSQGEGSAIEAVISAVLERINRADGTVCHEEVLGDYATFLNLKDGLTSTEPRCDYKMVDTDYLLPIIMKNYFVDSEAGRQRVGAFFNTTASFLVENSGLTYAQLAETTALKIMNATAAFAAEGGQIKENLIRLRENEPVGEWRDSNAGLGGGRIPYDVNAAIVPAGLRAIAALSRVGFFTAHPDWNETANKNAQVWEDESLRFFQVTVPQSDAVSLVESYVADSDASFPSNTANITYDVTYYGVAIDGDASAPSTNSSVVPVMNTDDCFRHFLLNTTNQQQLSAYLSQTADHILQPFPVGLSSDVGLFVANPAYAGNANFANSFSRTAYHGTVVWSWQLAMMGAGLSRQLARCESDSAPPDFCTDASLHDKILAAYDRLWDLIERNSAQLSSEVWSWTYDGDGGFQVEPLGALTGTESNIRQLWSLTFLAVHRESFGRP